MNDIFTIVNAVNNGLDPTQLLRNMYGNDPRAAQAFNMIQGKKPDELKQIALNLAANSGIDIQQLIQVLGIRT